MTLAQQIIIALAGASLPLDDDELVGQLHVVRQAVNQTCRTLEARGALLRFSGPNGKIVNQLSQTTTTGDPATTDPATAPAPAPGPPSEPAPAERPPDWISEDEVKQAVAAHLETDGYQVAVTWGCTSEPGVDASDSTSATSNARSCNMTPV